MLKGKRNFRGILDLKEKALFAGSLLIFLLGALLWYNYLHRTQMLTPQKLFEQAFEEPVDSTIGLEGNNSLNYGADFWIKFKAIGTVHLRHPEEYKPSVGEVGRQWFAEKWPNDYSLRDAAGNYQFSMSYKVEVGKIIQSWFLVNTKEKKYFYRYWSM